MTQYMLIRPDEDGDPIRWLTQGDLTDLLKDPMGTYGVLRFLDAYPGDPNYWDNDSALLVEVKIIVPQLVPATAWRLP